MWDMNQTNFGFDPVHKKTRKEVFLEEMDRVVPWAQLVALIKPHARAHTRRWAAGRRLRWR